MKRAKEMTAAEFRDALKRNGFSGPVLFWFRDLQNPGTSYSGVFAASTGKLMRRATIAELIRKRAQDAAFNAPKVSRSIDDYRGSS